MFSLVANARLRWKLALVVSVVLVGIVLQDALLLGHMHERMVTDRQMAVRQIIEQADSLVEHYHQKAQRGELSPVAAQQAALSAVEHLRYDTDNYVWINDLNAVMVMHPVKPSLNGKPLMEMEDAHGKQLFRAMVELVRKQGAGYVDYYWPKPGSDQPEAKISYVKKFAPWGWVLGTGVYVGDIETQFMNELWTTVGIAVSLITGALLLMGWLARVVVLPVEEVSETLHRTAEEHDLTRRIHSRRKDEFGRLGEAFNEMVAGFQHTVRGLGQVTLQLVSSSTELATITEQTSAGIQQQQRDIETVATAMEQMTATVHEVARSTDQASHSAEQVQQESHQGRRVVEEVRSSIEQLAADLEQAAQTIINLEQDSENIGRILDVIRSIAEQTNLLALNAAIEAARAGDQGRGFAVVADEVRTLASRTQNSTGEIRQMIERLQTNAGEAVAVMETSRQRAGVSVDLAVAAGTALSAIDCAVARITDMNAQIASASEEQSAVADEISRNLTAIRRVAIETSDGSAQITRASEELAQMACELQEAASGFQY